MLVTLLKPLLLCARVVLGPDPYELVQVVSAQDGGISREVVKVVHDDSDEEIEHEEGAEEDEGDEVGVGERRAAGLLGVQDLASGLVVLVGQLVALATRLAGQHDARPSLSRGAAEIVDVSVFLVWSMEIWFIPLPEKDHDAGPEGLEVDVAVVLGVRVEADVTEDLHPDDCVDEEQHGDEQDDVGQGLEGLNESPKQDSDGVTLPQELDQASGSEKTQKTDVDEVFLRGRKWQKQGLD